MGLGGISVWQLLIILAIVVMVFGTGRLKTIGGDLGSAIKGFRDSMDNKAEPSNAGADSAGDDAKNRSPAERAPTG